GSTLTRHICGDVAKMTKFPDASFSVTGACPYNPIVATPDKNSANTILVSFFMVQRLLPFRDRLVIIISRKEISHDLSKDSLLGNGVGGSALLEFVGATAGPGASDDQHEDAETGCLCGAGRLRRKQHDHYRQDRRHRCGRQTDRSKCQGSARADCEDHAETGNDRVSDS